MIVNGLGIVEFAKNVKVGCEKSQDFFSGYTYVEAREATVIVTIGENTHLNNSYSIICERSSISIGDDCLIGSGVTIVDSDFHNLEPVLRISEKDRCEPVEIQENVFIGPDAKILKGVTIGRNSVIGASAVVTRNVPENTVVAGNPAIVIKNL